MNKNKIIITSAAVVAAALVFGIWIVSFFSGGGKEANSSAKSDYAAVYLATGDIYFGKISWFPWPRLKDVWFLQRGVGQNGEQQLSINRFSSSFWGPVDSINLNSRQIVFWTRLRSDSQILKAFLNPAAVLGNANLPPARQQFSTSTFRGPNSPPPSAK